MKVWNYSENSYYLPGKSLVPKYKWISTSHHLNFLLVFKIMANLHFVAYFSSGLILWYLHFISQPYFLLNQVLEKWNSLRDIAMQRKVECLNICRHAIKFECWQTIKTKTERCFQLVGKMQFTWQSDCQPRDTFFHTLSEQVLQIWYTGNILHSNFLSVFQQPLFIF